MSGRLPKVLVLSMLVSMVALSGCASKGGARVEEIDPTDELDLEATDTTGIIRGVVVDAAIRPLGDVTVQLIGLDERSMVSTASGAFGFENLEPGAYFLEARKIGYLSIQQNADVVAGETEPKTVKIVMVQDATYQPFVETQQYEGFIQCTSSIIVLCGIPNILTGDNITSDRFAWDQSFSDNASLIQAEMVWASTQALSPGLYFELETLNDGCVTDVAGASRFMNNTSGVSPIYATINATQVQTWSIGSACPVWVSVFSVGPTCTPPVPQGVPLAGFSHCPGFTVQQRFTMYFHTFHGYLPPEGWRFAVDGEPPQPPR